MIVCHRNRQIIEMYAEKTYRYKELYCGEVGDIVADFIIRLGGVYTKE